MVGALLFSVFRCGDARMVVWLDHGLPDRLGEEGNGPGSTMQVRGAQVRGARDRGAKPGRLLFPHLVPSELEAGRAASTCVHVQPPAWLPVQWSKRTAPEGGRAVTAVGPAPETPGSELGRAAALPCPVTLHVGEKSNVHLEKALFALVVFKATPFQRLWYWDESKASCGVDQWSQTLKCIPSSAISVKMHILI